MDHLGFFETIVRPSTVQLGIFAISHECSADGRKLVVMHTVAKNVFTAFDSQLSGYLAAITGSGLPHASVETRVRDPETGAAWTPHEPRHGVSVPAALEMAASRTLGKAKEMRVRLGAWTAEADDLEQECALSRHMVALLGQALGICAGIGAPEFLEISGDLDRVLVRPAGAGMDLMVMDLHRGTVSVPIASEGGGAHQVPLFDFAEAVRTTPQVANYVARARHAVATAKEDAIRDFRQAAEERIMAFNAALAGRPLTGYRLEAAASLVARLEAGLGRSLVGLSESARMTAFDWVSLMRGTKRSGKAADEHPQLVV